MVAERPLPPTPGAARRRRWGVRGAVALSGAMLAACGGGLTIGFGYGSDFDNVPPSISLAASADSVPAGQPLRLIAAAADDTGIDAVIFFRFDGGEAVALGNLTRPPYEIVTTAPTDGRSAMTLFARAFDNSGNQADSARLTIAITR